MDSSGEELQAASSSPARAFHADGTQSVVYRQQVFHHSTTEPSKWIAVKVVSFRANATIKPHDVIKEAKILEDLKHPNVCLLLLGIATSQ